MANFDLVKRNLYPIGRLWRRSIRKARLYIASQSQRFFCRPVDIGAAWLNFVVHAVTTPDKVEALVQATGELLQAQATAIDPIHLERAKNQLTVARVRASERPFATMERAVEDLFAHGTVTSLTETVALINDIRSEELQGIFAQMLAHPPALSITGKGVSAKSARQLAATLTTSASPAS